MATGTILLPLTAAVIDPTIQGPARSNDARGRRFYLFDQTTDEVLLWVLSVPVDFASALTIFAQVSFPAATTGVYRLRSQVMCAADGVDVDTASFDTLEDNGSDVTVPGTAGLIDTVSYAPSNTDSIAASSYMAIQIGRENAVVGTNAAEDMQMWNAWLEYTTT